MDIQILPRHLSGCVTPPPSKSMAHRLLIAAALAEGTSTIENVAFSQDIEATLRCLRALGGAWKQSAPNTVEISGIGSHRRLPASELPQLSCGESGSTLRFFLPIALAVAGGGVFTGRGRLMQRPQGPYQDLFAKKGILWNQEGNILTVQGVLTSGEYRLPGNVSSQFFTGLLFALPLLDGSSTVVPTTAIESADYIRMTVSALGAAGVFVQDSTSGYEIAPASYRPFHQRVEADWSQAGFWYAAAFLGNHVRVEGLHPDSTQGDKVITELYRRLSQPGYREIDVSGCPDLLPPLAVMAARADGVTRFTGAARLRMKESDRLATTAALLQSLGIQAEPGADFLTVSGGPLTGGTVNGANDHRIVMAAAIAATACSSPVIIQGAEAVEKSYPGFWADYESLGGETHVL